MIGGSSRRVIVCTNKIQSEIVTRKRPRRAAFESWITIKRRGVMFPAWTDPAWSCEAFLHIPISSPLSNSPDFRFYICRDRHEFAVKASHTTAWVNADATA